MVQTWARLGEYVQQPWGRLCVAVLIMAPYLPTFSFPFDFNDDAALIYASPIPWAERVWETTLREFHNQGPFRPVAWAHWLLLATFNDQLIAHRSAHWLQGLASVFLFLWFLTELKIPPAAAVMSAALAFWNPVRNEVWLGLGLSESFAMPYALLGLASAVRAARTGALRWDLLAWFASLLAIGCKNPFVAIVPAQTLLRLTCTGLPWRQALTRDWRRLLLVASPMLCPIIHIIAYKLDPIPKFYKPNKFALSKVWDWLTFSLRALSVEFVGIGLLCWLWVLAARRRSEESLRLAAPLPMLILSGLALWAAGVVIYLPFGGISGRYSMPGIFGLDLLLALLFTCVLAEPASLWKRCGGFALGVGLFASLVGNGLRQERAAVRANFLWDAAQYVEAQVPGQASVAWQVDPARNGLSEGEGTHFKWHLSNRGRNPVHIEVRDSAIAPAVDGFDYALTGTDAAPSPTWQLERTFERRYRFGRETFRCYLWKAPDQAVQDNRPATQTRALNGN